MADFSTLLQEDGTGLSDQIRLDQFGTDIGGSVSEPVDFAKILSGEQFEPETGELGEPGLTGFGPRFAMGRGGNFQEKAERFKQFFPEGDLAVRDVDGEPTLLFRATENDPFRKVDAGLTEKFEPIEDIADFLGDDLEAVIGEIATTVGTRGGSLIGLAARLFTGAAGGEAFKEFEQTVERTQRESLSDISGRAVTKGVVSGITGPVGEVALRGAANWMTGRNIIGLKPGAKTGMKRAEALGLDPMPLNVIAESPLIQRAGVLSQAIVPTLGRYVSDLRTATREVVSKLRNVPAKVGFREQLDRIEKVARERAIRRSGLSRSTSEVDLAQSIQTWDDVAQARINAKYTFARGIEEPQFALETIKTAAERFIKTADATGIDLDPALKETLDSIQNFDGAAKSIQLSDGSVIDVSVTEQLNAFAEQLFAIAQPPLGQVKRRTEKVAGRMLGEIKNMMDDPGNVSPEFKIAWKDAQSAASDRFTALEKISVVQARKHENPEIFLDNLISQQKKQSVQFLKNAGVGDDVFKDAFVNRMLLKPGSIVDDLNKMTPEFRRMFVTEGEERVLRQLGKQTQKLDRLGIDDMLQKQATAGKVVDELMNRGSGSMKVLRELIDQNGGRNGATGKAVRAGIIDRLYKKSIVEINGVKRLNPSIFQSEIKRLSDTGATVLMLPSDIKNLMKASTVEGFLKTLPDFGASLAGQETVSGLRGIATGDMKAFSIALLNLMENLGVGRFLTNPEAIKFLAGGAGKEGFKRSGALAATLSVMSTALTDADTRLIEFDQIMNSMNEAQ